MHATSFERRFIWEKQVRPEFGTKLREFVSPKLGTKLKEDLERRFTGDKIVNQATNSEQYYSGKEALSLGQK